MQHHGFAEEGLAFGPVDEPRQPGPIRGVPGNHSRFPCRRASLSQHGTAVLISGYGGRGSSSEIHDLVVASIWPRNRQSRYKATLSGGQASRQLVRREFDRAIEAEIARIEASNAWAMTKIGIFVAEVAEESRQRAIVPQRSGTMPGR